MPAPKSNPSQPPEGTGPQAAPPRGDLVREVTLVKNGKQFTFRYTAGDELRLMKSLADMARDPASGIGWFDAALLSHQMGRGMEQELLDRLKA
ncbi:MAG: hypothetical protein NTW19_05430 [Planctomycetota bacterium]|nr:hypothetical protein [Planctomycetota bacterium]